MIFDAAETVLGYFGFDRTVYGNKKNIGPGKWRWLQELRLERENDIKAETIGQYGIRNMKQYSTRVSHYRLLFNSLFFLTPFF